MAALADCCGIGCVCVCDVERQEQLGQEQPAVRLDMEAETACV